MINDVYKRFIVPGASESHQVLAGRLCTVLLMGAAGVVAMYMQSAAGNFGIMLSMTAGMGLVYMLRWFWWRVSAISEIVVLVVPSVFVVYFWRIHPSTGLPELDDWQRMGLTTLMTTVCWLVATLMTRPTDTGTLVRFYKRVQPGGPGWAAFLRRAEAEGHSFAEVDRVGQLPLGVACVLLGCVAIYSALFATGYWLYGHTTAAGWLTLAAVVSTVLLFLLWRRLVYPLRIQVRIEGKL